MLELLATIQRQALDLRPAGKALPFSRPCTANLRGAVDTLLSSMYSPFLRKNQELLDKRFCSWLFSTPLAFKDAGRSSSSLSALAMCCHSATPTERLYPPRRRLCCCCCCCRCRCCCTTGVA